MKFLKTIDEKCKGCLICEATCSALFFKENSTEKSRISVSKSENGTFHITACNQCGICVSECPVKALSVNKAGVIMLNAKLCIGCLACVAICPTGAMKHYQGALSPFKCIACGTCVEKCPENALMIVEEER